jgi:hypothetical protein
MCHGQRPSGGGRVATGLQSGPSRLCRSPSLLCEAHLLGADSRLVLLDQGCNREKVVTEYPGVGSRRLVVRRIQRVVGREAGILRAVGWEEHSHAAAGHMEVARAEHGIRGVEEMARRTDLPAEEGHRSGLAGVEDNGPVEAGGNGLAEGGMDPAGEGRRRAADSPGAEALKEGLAARIVGVRILRTEVLLTGLAHAKPRNVVETPLTVMLIRHVMETVTCMYASKKGPG